MIFSLLLIVTMLGSFSGVGAQHAASISLDQDDTIKLGGLFPLTGTLAGGGVERDAAARMAVGEINADDTILAGKTLELLVKDTATDPATGVQVAGEVIAEGAVGIVGAASSGVSSAIAAGPGKTSKIPQISYSSTSPSLSDKTEHPYFLRVVPPDSVQGVALANIVNDFGWDTVATLASSDDYGLGGIGVFETSAEGLGIEIATSQRFAQGAADVKTQLQAIADSGAKIIVLNVIVGDAQTVFAQAGDVGLTAEEGYVWIGTDGPTQGAVFEDDATIKANMQGMIGTAPNRGSGAVFDDFLDIWEDCYGSDADEYAGCGDRTPNTYATFAYDAVYTFARAIDHMIEEGKDYTDGDLLLEHLYETDFTGATGPISFNADGDREGVYDILNLQGDAFEKVGSWDKVNGRQLTGTIFWNGVDDTNIPADSSGLPGFGMFISLMSLFVLVPILRRKN
ncbi:MAG: ABC transporter substrate-binding protein [Candidatus Kariarchaeaceae archaeon]